MRNVVNSLLAIPQADPETRKVFVPRLNLTVTLKEIDYNTLQSCRTSENAHFHYLLKSTVSPDFKDTAWYQEKMGCPTPVDAMKKLLRPGEVERLCKVADDLNGYGLDSITIIDEKAIADAATAAAVEHLEKN